MARLFHSPVGEFTRRDLLGYSGSRETGHFVLPVADKELAIEVFVNQHPATRQGGSPALLFDLQPWRPQDTVLSRLTIRW